MKKKARIAQLERNLRAIKIEATQQGDLLLIEKLKVEALQFLDNAAPKRWEEAELRDALRTIADFMGEQE